MSTFCLSRAALGPLIQALGAQGYTVVGPTVCGAAVTYDVITADTDLPVGWEDIQEPGRYRLQRRDDAAVFATVVGPQAWKKYLFAPRRCAWRARRTGATFAVESEAEPVPRYAFFGVRPCELQALAIQDRVFMGGAWSEPHYHARRDAVSLVVVQCARAASTCFCASIHTGPRAAGGFDLALTEILEPGRHEFVVEVGTPRGAATVWRQ